MTKRPISKSRTAVRALVFVLIAALGIGWGNGCRCSSACTSWMRPAARDLTGAHSETVTAEWQRCADFMAQILPTCQQQAADNTKQTLNEFSAAFDACR